MLDIPTSWNTHVKLITRPTVYHTTFDSVIDDTRLFRRRGAEYGPGLPGPLSRLEKTSKLVLDSGIFA
jgi:hypothetical protein